jgi:hypothetical protein
MTEPHIFWALLVGFAIGGAVVWFALGRLPRRSDDASPEERVVEAAWIAGSLDETGRQVPAGLVEEILELHTQYLAGPALELRPDERDALRAARAQPGESPSGPGAPPGGVGTAPVDSPPQARNRT